MIKPDQIPDEVVEAFVDAFHGKDMTRKASIAAALNAWPGVTLKNPVEDWHWLAPPLIIIPLPLEDANAEA